MAAPWPSIEKARVQAEVVFLEMKRGRNTQSSEYQVIRTLGAAIIEADAVPISYSK